MNAAAESGASAPRLAEVLSILEAIAPAGLAEEWDNVGLQIGDREAVVRAVRVALDPGPEVIAAACRQGADLLVTHHPLFFRPIRRLDLATPLGRSVARAIQAGLAVVSLHTNLDAAENGLNDMLAERLGLRAVRPLVPSSGGGGGMPHGMGRVGELEGELSLAQFAALVKGRLALEGLRWAGRESLGVRRVAVSTGSGGSLVEHFIASGAEVFVTGDMRYHDARAIEEAGCGLVDVGHFHSERIMKEALAARLGSALAARGYDVDVRPCAQERDPFRTL